MMTDTPRHQIYPDDLTPEQLKELCAHLSLHNDTLVMAHDRLLTVLNEIEGLPRPARRKLKQWSDFVRRTITESNKVVAGIVRPESGKLN